MTNRETRRSELIGDTDPLAPSIDLRPVDESRVITRFRSTEGLPLVLEDGEEPGLALLSVEKVDGASRVLDTVAKLAFDTATGRITGHEHSNARGQWRDQQIRDWLPLAQARLISHRAGTTE